jgi:carboxymethylenebutenolidase
MIHEWWGLNDYIKREVERLQKELGDVTVIALDLYDSKVATDPQTAGQYVSGLKETRARAIIQAAIEYVGKEAQVATLGWCFGGGWSMQTALMLGKQASGCVIYYGMPEKDVKKLKTLRCDVIGIFGTQDRNITPKVVEEFQKNMKTAKKKLTVYNYDAVHAFANPSNPKYDKEKADDAHVHVLAFLKEALKL